MKVTELYVEYRGGYTDIARAGHYYGMQKMAYTNVVMERTELGVEIFTENELHFVPWTSVIRMRWLP